MWRCERFPEFINSLCNNQLIDEVIIINNDVSKTPNIKFNDKIKQTELPSNIFVNPSWNLGVQFCKNDLVCLMNDDIEFDDSVFNFLKDKLTENIGIVGLDISMSDTSYDLKQIQERPFGFGALMFFHKKSYIKIPKELKIFFGDD